MAAPQSQDVWRKAPGLRLAKRPGIDYNLMLPIHYKETVGSPEFPGYPREYMTWSQTPVVTLNTRLNAFRSAAFQYIQTVGFPL